MKNLTWQNPEQLFVAQVLINKVKSKCCGIKGGMKSAEKDFNDMNLSDVTEFNTKYGTAKRGRNENGETVILRPGSSDGAPTIERQVNGRKKTEIRYDD